MVSWQEAAGGGGADGLARQQLERRDAEVRPSDREADNPSATLVASKCRLLPRQAQDTRQACPDTLRTDTRKWRGFLNVRRCPSVQS